MDLQAQLTARMAEFNSGQPALTQHLLKVHGFARAIGLLEGLDADTQEALELAALTHDIGIKPCLEKYGTCTGKMQEEEGPGHAAPLLAALGVPAQVAERVCFLIAHHHTYDAVDGMDYRILLEADFLVNVFEGKMDREDRRAAHRDIFRTQAGKAFLRAMYPEDEEA